MNSDPTRRHERPWADHPGLAWLRASEQGRSWLDRLPAIVDECADRWSLRFGDPFPYAFASLALPATLPEGQDAVLKIQFPDRESDHEAAALALWAGNGAVRLLAYDQDRRALLLERCTPGTPLKELTPDEALDVVVDLLPRHWTLVAQPFRTLTDEAARWSSQLPIEWEHAGRPFERELLDAGLEAIGALSGSQDDQVLVNQDLHADNILRAEREPWLLIDPKPLTGERAFGVASIVRGGELGHSREAIRRRLHRLTDELDLDRERARGWALAQTLAWAFDDGEALTSHVEVARWLTEIR